MKRVTILISVLLTLTVAQAQKVYFIYLQSENNQPFFVRLGEKIYNSTAAGYLILSNLRDSAYSIRIGLQGSTVPDQAYPVTINKKDQGYILKNFGEKGWGLFNLQSMAVIMPAATLTTSTVKTEKREGSEFTDLLVKASDDSTIRERPVITKAEETKTGQTTAVEKQESNAGEKKETQPQKSGETKTESVNPASTGNVVSNPVADVIKPAVVVAGAATIDNKEEKKDTGTVKLDTASKQESKPLTETKTDSMQEMEKYQRSTVSLYAESSTTQGIGLTFLDNNMGGIIDTIRILIPNETKKEIIAAGIPVQKENLNPIPVDSIKQSVAAPAETKNKNCTQEANDDDFFKLRKRMAGENNEDAMITEAQKAFKTKCYSTHQVKNLGSLFLTDQGRYKFYDAAYAYVTDPGEFPALQSELKDIYYINRFKAMLRQ